MEAVREGWEERPLCFPGSGKHIGLGFFFYEHLTPHLGFGPPGPVRSALGGECMVGGEIKIKGTQ